MRRFRFHLGTLVILVLLLGVSFAALRESNEIWDRSVLSLTLAVLLISILLAVHRTEKRRAFWLGFALFGSAYLGLSLVPSIEPRLITTKALAYLDSKMPRSIPAGLGYFEYSDSTLLDLTSAPGSNTVWLLNSLAGSSGSTEHFVRIGHSLLALIAALLGGQLSRYLHAKTTPGTSGSVPAPVLVSNDSEV
jgi:hypothetical protein